MILINANLVTVTLPMSVSFKHAQSNRDSSESLILILDDGFEQGYGECAPRTYVTGESINSVTLGVNQWIKERLPEIANGLANADNLENFLHQEINYLRIFSPNTRCVIELALIDLLESKINKSLGPTPIRDHAQFVPVLDGHCRWSASTEIIKKSQLVKIKTADSINETCSRIRMVRMQTDALILVDANNSWVGSNTESAVRLCLDAGATWFEEPCASRDYKSLRKVRELGGKVLLDESVNGPTDVIDAATQHAADGVNIRVSKCGGLIGALDTANSALTYGLERYYGVQVAEIGTLITAGRLAALSDHNPLGIESGQSDVFFNAEELWISSNRINRTEASSTPKS